MKKMFVSMMISLFVTSFVDAQDYMSTFGQLTDSIEILKNQILEKRKNDFRPVENEQSSLLRDTLIIYFSYNKEGKINTFITYYDGNYSFYDEINGCGVMVVENRNHIPQIEEIKIVKRFMENPGSSKYFSPTGYLYLCTYRSSFYSNRIEDTLNINDPLGWEEYLIYKCIIKNLKDILKIRTYTKVYTPWKKNFSLAISEAILILYISFNKL